MNRTNPRAVWVLPENLNPPETVCFQIVVPKERFWIAAFKGAIFNLAKAYNWGNDDAHSAQIVAKYWLGVFDNLKSFCGEPLLSGMEIDLGSPLRIDCNCNVFVTCCDGTEKQILTSDQVKALIASPGGGTTQPAPGGGQQCYHAYLNANSQWLIPVPVSTGDTIALNNAKGAVSNSHNVDWSCPDGSLFFAGSCVPLPKTDPSNPVPASPTSLPVVKIGSNFYPVIPGTTFTVPAGVSSIQPLLQVNDSMIAGLSGNFEFDVCVVNNQTGAWVHVLDFRAGPQGFVLSNEGGTPPTRGQWTGGTGWQSTTKQSPTGEYRRGIVIHRAVAFQATRIILTANYTLGASDVPSDTAQAIINAGTPLFNVLFSAPPPSGNGQMWDTGVINTPITDLELYSDTDRNGSSPAGFTGSDTYLTLEIHGTGPDPF